jgi:hypothetical protein
MLQFETQYTPHTASASAARPSGGVQSDAKSCRRLPSDFPGDLLVQIVSASVPSNVEHVPIQAFR